MQSEILFVNMFIAGFKMAWEFDYLLCAPISLKKTKVCTILDIIRHWNKIAAEAIAPVGFSQLKALR